jgi:hypothetical protein
MDQMDTPCELKMYDVKKKSYRTIAGAKKAYIIDSNHIAYMTNDNRLGIFDVRENCSQIMSHITDLKCKQLGIFYIKTDPVGQLKMLKQKSHIIKDNVVSFDILPVCSVEHYRIIYINHKHEIYIGEFSYDQKNDQIGTLIEKKIADNGFKVNVINGELVSYITKDSKHFQCKINPFELTTNTFELTTNTCEQKIEKFGYHGNHKIYNINDGNVSLIQSLPQYLIPVKEQLNKILVETNDQGQILMYSTSFSDEGLFSIYLV